MSPFRLFTGRTKEDFSPAIREAAESGKNICIVTNTQAQACAAKLKWRNHPTVTVVCLEGVKRIQGKQSFIQVDASKPQWWSILGGVVATVAVLVLMWLFLIGVFSR